MFYKKFLLLLATLLAFAGTTMALAGPNGNVSGQSDCSSVVATWNITNTFGNINWTLNLSSSSLGTVTRDIADSGSGSTTFNVTPASGETLTLTLLESGNPIDTASFQCNSSAGLEASEPELTLIGDGRLEPFASDHVIYPISDQGIVVYNDSGISVLFISLDTIETLGIPVDAAVLLGATPDSYVQVYRLPSGQFQANVGPDDEGKVHVVIWEGLGNIPAFNISTSTYTVN